MNWTDNINKAAQAQPETWDEQVLAEAETDDAAETESEFSSESETESASESSSQSESESGSEPKKLGRPANVEGRKRVRELLDAAGPDGMRVADLEILAGVSSRALYRWFQDWDDVQRVRRGRFAFAKYVTVPTEDSLDED